MAHGHPCKGTAHVAPTGGGVRQTHTRRGFGGYHPLPCPHVEVWGWGQLVTAISDSLPLIAKALLSSSLGLSSLSPGEETLID